MRLYKIQPEVEFYPGRNGRKRQAPSVKLQAPSLTTAEGYCRIQIERNNMDKEINDRSVNPLIRIAKALEEILRLVKADQEKMEKRLREEN
jgi:hypothetical protein